MSRGQKEALECVRRELCELCENTEDALHAVAQGDSIEAAFARGRRHEAKGIRNAMCEVIREMRSEPTEVWLCLCISPPSSVDGKPQEQTYAFSSMEAAGAFCDTDKGRVHVVYSRVLDHPEASEATIQ